MAKRVIYMDNAATSFPKPPQVVDAMVRFMTEVGANPGRSRHALSREASHAAETARELLALLFHIPDPKRIIFTLNATESLNTVLFGFLKPGDHVIMSQMEHNSVIRPLRYLEAEGIVTVSVAPCDRMGMLDPEDVRSLLRKETALVAINHASNVCGTIQDIAVVKQVIGEIPLLVDAAQTAGTLPIDVSALGIDFLAFTGHKGLYGPQGTGGLYIREGLVVRPLKRGGTGSVSEKEHQPDFFPDAMESGTQNNVGLSGLAEGVRFVLDTGVENIRRHEMSLLQTFIDGVIDAPGLTLYGPLKPESRWQSSPSPLTKRSRTACISPLAAAETGRYPPHSSPSIPMRPALYWNRNSRYSFASGLHCAPLAHRALGSFPDGTVRFSLGYFNTQEDVDIAIQAVRKIAEKKDYVDW